MQPQTGATHAAALVVRVLAKELQCQVEAKHAAMLDNEMQCPAEWDTVLAVLTLDKDKWCQEAPTAVVLVLVYT